MEFRILGPLEVRNGDRVIPLAAGQQRALLALLLLHANETISRDRLIHELWGERPPRTAAKALQGHVSALRTLLEPDRAPGHAGRLILTSGSGYELRLKREQLDHDRFERLCHEGRHALARSDSGKAAALLREALTLWRGPPLADLAYEPFAQAEIARLDELRLVTREDRLEADLASGRDAELVGELEALVKEHPLRERLRGQLMLALYRSGRQAEALGVYQDTRRVLVDELGIEPSRELQELERAILRQDGSLDRGGPVEAPSPSAGAGRSTRRAARAQAASPLVGRERELSALVGALDSAWARRGRLTLIAGEPGIGKSRLADELADRASGRGAVMLFGRAWEAGGAPAYWPWVQAIRSYVRDRDPHTIREQLGSGAADVAQMLPELRDLLPEIGRPVSLDPEGSRFRLFDATATFLRNAAEAEPLVVVLDDLHAADTPSLLLLQFVASQLAEMRVLVLGLYRDVELGPEHPLSSALTELARHAPPPLKLSGLSERDVSRVIEARHGVGPAQGLTAAIHRETEGNPLFVGEILRLLAEDGRLEQPAGAAPHRLAIPATVREVIRQRLRRLSEDCVEVLVFASILGREFNVDALRRVSGQELDPVLDLLDEAISSGVVGEVPGAHGRLRFAHVLIRDVLYDGLTATRRMRLHRQVGEALEALYSKDPGPRLAELAHHFCEAVPAGDAEKAVQYARRAADRAAALLAYEEAARLYAIAIETVEAHAAGDEVDRCVLLLGLGEAQARAGDVPSAKETFLRAADTAREAGLAEHFSRAALGYGGRFVWTRAWGDTHLVPLLEQALTVLPPEDSRLRVQLLARLAGGPLRDTSPRELRETMARDAVEMARRLGDPPTLAYALEGRYQTNWGPDVLEERLAVANELIEVAENARDMERAYAGHDARFYALLEAADLPAAYRDHDAANRLAHELRQPAQLWDSAVRHAELALFEGRFAEAETAIHDALDVGRLAQTANAQHAFDLQLYALRREQGRLGEILAVVERAADAARDYPVWRYVLADVYTQLDRTDDARAALEVLAADDFRVHLDELWLFSISLLPEVCRHLADADRAAPLYELMRPYARRNAIAVPQLCGGSVSRGLGVLAATMSNWDDAVRDFERALAMNAEMGARPWLAHTRYDYALMLFARGGAADRLRARELLGSAMTLAHELGMSALGERVATLLSA